MSPVFPRGIEVLLKKASVDPDFRTLLLENPGEAATSIELQLDPMEQAMLRNMPAGQLETIIDQIEVPQPQRRAFLGSAAVAMLAVLAGSQTALAGGPQYGKPMGGGGMGGGGGIRGDTPPGGTFGNRPDEIPPRQRGEPRNLRLEIYLLVHRTLEMDFNRVKPTTRIVLEDKKLVRFRQAIYDRFDVRMPMKTLKSLRTVKLLTDYIVESHEGYDEKEKKNSGDTVPGS